MFIFLAFLKVVYFYLIYSFLRPFFLFATHSFCLKPYVNNCIMCLCEFAYDCPGLVANLENKTDFPKASKKNKTKKNNIRIRLQLYTHVHKSHPRSDWPRKAVNLLVTNLLFLLSHVLLLAIFNICLVLPTLSIPS